MSVVIILGSRNPTGQTAHAAEALAAGAAEKGVKCEKVFLPEMKVERCRQCDAAGWGLCRTEGRCVLADDFTAITEKIRAAQGVVFATPVYFSDLSESLKAYLDRLRRCARHESGKPGIAGKAALGICVAGGGGGGAPACAWNLEKVLNTCGFDLLDMVPARRQNLEHKLEILKVTGRWMAAQLAARSDAG